MELRSVETVVAALNAAITATGNGNLTGNVLNNGLTGNDGKNILDGGTGNDKLDGGSGADSLLGGVGNDAMIGGAGNDTMRGGDGVDLADFAAAGLDISIDLATGRAKGDGRSFRTQRSEERFLKPCRMFEVLTLPSAFPPCGHDVNRDIAPTRRTYRLKK